MFTGGELKPLAARQLLIAGMIIVTAFVTALLVVLLAIRAKPSLPTSAIIDQNRLPANCVMVMPHIELETVRSWEVFTPNSDTYVLLCGTLKKPG